MFLDPSAFIDHSVFVPAVSAALPLLGKALPGSLYEATPPSSGGGLLFSCNLPDTTSTATQFFESLPLVTVCSSGLSSPSTPKKSLNRYRFGQHYSDALPGAQSANSRLWEARRAYGSSSNKPRVYSISSPYATLGVTTTATQSEIKAAYKSLALQYHPDTCGSDERFKEISTAYSSVKHRRQSQLQKEKTKASYPRPDPRSGSFTPQSTEHSDVWRSMFEEQEYGSYIRPVPPPMREADKEQLQLFLMRVAMHILYCLILFGAVMSIRATYAKDLFSESSREAISMIVHCFLDELQSELDGENSS